MVDIDIPVDYQTIKTKLELIVARKHYTKTENDSQLNGKADSIHEHTSDEVMYDSQSSVEDEIDSIYTSLSGKQATLVSGTNIRTVNGNDLLGSGDIVIGATGTIDDTVTQNSPNPVKSSGIYSALSNKANSTHSHSISDVTNLQSSLNDKLDFDDLLDLVYPVGAIYISANPSDSVCPIQALLGGTWERIQDKFLLASTDQQGVGTTGGSADAVVVEHTHTQQQHRHGLGGDWSSGSGSQTAYTYSANRGRTTKYSDYQTPTINSTGESGTGKNMPPYLMVNVWKRTA